MLFDALPSLIFMIAAGALFVWICTKFPPTIVLGVVAYSIISESSSLIYLEIRPTYIIETAMVSGPSGSMIFHFSYGVVILLSSFIIMRSLMKIWMPSARNRSDFFGHNHYNSELKFAINAVFLLLFIQFINALLSPPYAFPGSGVTRHAFWHNIRLPMVADVIGVLVIFTPAIAGIAMAYGKVTGIRYFSKAGYALLGFYALYLVFTGARFNGSLLVLFYWITGYWSILWLCGHKLQIKRLGFVVTLSVIGFLFVGYLEIADRGIARLEGGAWQGFLYRIFALQGDIFYAAHVRVMEGNRASIALLLEGMETTIRTYMPSGLAALYVQKGVNLVAPLSANSIMVFGHAGGLIPLMIYGCILGAVSSLYFLSIFTGRFILVLPCSYLILWTYSGYNQGSFAFLFDLKFSLFLGAVIFWYLLPDRRIRRRATTPHQRLNKLAQTGRQMKRPNIAER